jgi:hypothetical protein
MEAWVLIYKYIELHPSGPGMPQAFPIAQSGIFMRVTTGALGTCGLVATAVQSITSSTTL